MTKHDKANIIHSLIRDFLKIKDLSHSGEIDRLCMDGMDKLRLLTDAENIQKQLDEVRARMIDPTN